MREILHKKYGHLSIIVSAGLVVLIIMQPWSLYFLNDDYEHIPMAGSRLLVTKNFLRPVANAFLFLDKYLYGKWALGYFFTTWIFHGAAAVSIYYAIREVIKKYIPDLSANTALFAALFFLFYPFHAEPLFWIIGRGAVIAAMFAILSLYFYLRKNESIVFFVISLLLFITALFTYETIWNLIFFYCLISFFNIKNHFASQRKESFHAGIFLLTFITYFLVRYYFLNTLTGGYADIDNNIFNLSVLSINAAKLVSRNFTPPFISTFFFIVFFSFSAVLFVVAIVFMFKENKAIGWLMIILWLGVFSGIITAAPLGIDTHGNESERFIYYSSFYFCFFLAVATALFRKKWQYLINSIIIILFASGLITYNSNYRYTSTITKTSLKFLKKYANYKKAYFIDVPGEYKGALIFRSGLPEAIHWIDAECKYESVTIISTKEDASGIIPFKTGEKKWSELTREKSFDSKSNTFLLKDSLNRSFFLNKNDTVFWFTGDGLYKVNIP